MEIIRTVAEMRAWRKQAGKLAFVPTMGNLHEGHLKLVAAARERAEKVVVSIFVNRLQFGQGEDFDAYPRTFDADCAKLAAAGVDALFFPTERELYPRVRQDFNVEPPHIQDELCGAFRPGHFRGVATVVTKLFNIVQPDLACFGKKDYQQLHVIQAMIADLNSPIEIVPVDTGRAGDGLALSSRNGYLSAEERAEAPRLYRNLSMIRDGLLSGSQDYAALENAARDDLAAAGWTVDYVEVRQADTLEVAHAGEKRLVALAAARLGKTRLIDNIEVFR
ncbi:MULTISPECIES: pantoate--beta-alanine ligase [Chromobacteriaceae]|uniref:Pantothenate synthetase n=2 Tax=Chromobacteriaceae TaxID=1499392 RepID=A0ABV0CIV6_9NEIS|nr:MULTISPECIES: pantoate--beta-alanine ligase [Chromobacteriaceae]AVG16626.1 pantoate--beta-alanine ligase [Chromobacterium vaccinii]ERE03082.1 pantoate--beta-alanine ligase [Pseudogulbenkiania ferrooxidans EGD-HP2]